MDETQAPPPPGCAARYRPLRVLGTGGFATVWRGDQVALGREVAIKVLHHDHLDDVDMVERFLEEARITAALSDPHLVRVIDHGVEDGVPWIVYELVNGPTLRDILTERGRVPVAEALEVGAQIASALAAAHAAGVLHRDIKPENVMQSARGHYKVTDFGIARWTSSGRARTQTGVILGTAAYLAPERIHDGACAPSSDIYAVGVLLHEMITGRRPYDADTIYQLLEMHLRAPIPSLCEAVPEIPESIERLVKQALAKQPQERFESAAALRDALRSAGEGLEVVVPQRRRSTDRTAALKARSSVSTPVLPPGAEARGGARARATALGAAAAITLVLAVGLWRFRAEPVNRPSPSAVAPPAPRESPSVAPRVALLEPAQRAEILQRVRETERLEDDLFELVRAHERREDPIGIAGFEGNTAASEFADGKTARQRRREWASATVEAAPLRARVPAAMRLASDFETIARRAGTELEVQAPLAGAMVSLLEVAWYLDLQAEAKTLREVIARSAGNVTPSWMVAFVQARAGLQAAQGGGDAGTAERMAKSALKLLDLDHRGAGGVSRSAEMHVRLLIQFALRNIHVQAGQTAQASEREQACRELLGSASAAKDRTASAARLHWRVRHELGYARPAK